VQAGIMDRHQREAANVSDASTIAVPTNSIVVGTITLFGG